MHAFFFDRYFTLLNDFGSAENITNQNELKNNEMLVKYEIDDDKLFIDSLLKFINEEDLKILSDESYNINNITLSKLKYLKMIPNIRLDLIKSCLIKFIKAFINEYKFINININDIEKINIYNENLNLIWSPYTDYQYYNTVNCNINYLNYLTYIYYDPFIITDTKILKNYKLYMIRILYTIICALQSYCFAFTIKLKNNKKYVFIKDECFESIKNIKKANKSESIFSYIKMPEFEIENFDKFLIEYQYYITCADKDILYDSIRIQNIYKYITYNIANNIITVNEK